MILILAIVAFLALAGALYYALEHRRPFYLSDDDTDDLTPALIHWRKH